MSVAYSPDGTKLAAGLGHPSYSMVVFDTQTNMQICSVRAHKHDVNAVVWCPCGQWLASGGDDKMVKVYDAKTFEVKWPLIPTPLPSVCVHPKNTRSKKITQIQKLRKK